MLPRTPTLTRWSLPSLCRLIAVVGLSVISTTAITGCTSSDFEPKPEAVWSTSFDAEKHGALSGVWGTAPDDVWTVGGTTDTGEIHHFDGTSWTKMTIPDGVPLLSWVYGFSPDDVWVVGTKGAVLHWDGASWSSVDSNTTADLWGVWGASKEDFWAVGGTVNAGVPVLLHYVKGAFVQVTLDPEENTREATAIFKVWGIDGTIFAVGEAGLIIQWDGKAWRAVSGGAKANDDFVSLWGTSADNIVAVGGRSQARIARWNGTTWTTVAPAATPGLNAVFMTESKEAVVGGILGVGGTFAVDSMGWNQEETDTGETIHGIWCDGVDTCHAVGGLFSEPQHGLALKRVMK